MTLELSNSSVRIRRRSSTWFTTNNPILGQAQFGYETDTQKMKVGDGVTLWNDLPYMDTNVSDDATPPPGYCVLHIEAIPLQEVPNIANERTAGLTSRQLLGHAEEGCFELAFDEVSNIQLIEVTGASMVQELPMSFSYRTGVTGDGQTRVDVHVQKWNGTAWVANTDQPFVCKVTVHE